MISQDIVFQKEISINQQPVFVLDCISSGGPVSQLTWSINGTDIDSEWDGIVQHPSQIFEPMTSTYYHRLTVTGRQLGIYRCTVSNNKPSIAHKDIHILSEFMHFLMYLLNEFALIKKL